MAGEADIRAAVVREIEALLVDDGKTPPAELGDDDALLESGLDSLGFAVLVTRLEDSLGFDPFTELSEPVYPRTLGEFVQTYAAHAG